MVRAYSKGDYCKILVGLIQGGDSNEEAKSSITICRYLSGNNALGTEHTE